MYGACMTQSFKLPKLTEGEKKLRDSQARAVRPKRAATIVLTHGDPKNPHILMGRRASRHDFMPSVYVFPGGRVDRSDSYADYTGTMTHFTRQILQSAYTQRQALACLLCAIRETWEETGVWIAQDGIFERNVNDASWDAFRQAGKVPDISNIDVFGRAITPPHRHKRFDAWFFIKHLEGERPRAEDSRELLDVGWYTFDDIEDLPLQRATVMMVDVLKSYLRKPRARDKIFFSRMIRGEYVMGEYP